jgi:hypothetical protein
MKKTNFLNINLNSDDYQLNDYLILFDKFNSQPNKIVLNDSYTTDLFIEKITQKNENLLTELIPSEENFIINERVLSEIIEDVWISYLIIDKDTDNSIVTDLTIYYKNVSDYDKISEIVSNISETSISFDIDDDINTDKLSTFVINAGNLETESINVDDIDNNCRYNPNIIKESDKLSKKIKKYKKGLSLICGEKGVGKTNLAKHIALKTDRNVVFIPNNMVDLTINNPEFFMYLTKVNNLLIIIDDCEFLTHNQIVKVNSFSNNISQLVDGVISDKINLQIILIFNEDLDDIDEDILDINNLIDIIEVDYLDIEVANELSKLLGKNKKFKNKTKLIDVLRNKSILKTDKIGL